ncbi:MAG: hypothetical protein J1E33_06545 [Alistipes sp.]|nr:hypothetical protein [Alistipes sp.]
MRTGDLRIAKYRWDVRLYFAVTDYYIDDILESLSAISCPKKIMRRVRQKMAARKLDTGFTYSNKRLRQSVMVVGITSSPAEFLDSFEHELRHLVDDIAKTDGLALSGEAVAYLTGDTNRTLWPVIHDFICCCHE